MFKIADGQVTKEKIMNKKTGKEEIMKYKKSDGFISQEDLGKNINAASPEAIKQQLLDSGFIQLNQL